ncbi:MAG: PAS domain-containing protein [Chloroflexi bacterium]|nr:PAS domain-containing protein [Chloroflexota bacterium]
MAGAGISGAAAIAELLEIQGSALTLEQLRPAYDIMAFAVVVRDAQERIIYANPAALDLIGHPLAELVGSPSYTGRSQIYGEAGEIWPRGETVTGRVLRTGLPVRNATIRIDVSNARTCWLQIDAVPVKVAGRIVQVVTSFVDVSPRVLAEQAAEEAAQRWQSLVGALGDAVIVSDGLRVLSINRAAEDLFGWTAAEAVGGVMAFLPDEELEKVRARSRRVLEEGETLEYEGERLTRSGGRVPVLATLSPLRNAEGKTQGIIGVYKDMTAHRQLEQQARDLAVLRTRERIAMDLHDGIMQSLYGVSLTLAAHSRAAQNQPNRRRVDFAVEQLNALIDEIRDYTRSLQPRRQDGRELQRGLSAILHEFAPAQRPSIRMRVEDGVGQNLSPEVVENVLYIVHEALSNARRHSDASVIQVNARTENGETWISIEDNGRGFDLNDEPSGQGLHNMRLRAQSIDASLALKTAPGHGAEVSLRLPNQPAAEAG